MSIPLRWKTGKHEIGYHSNFHSTQPTPALYLSNLTWDEGVAEFNRRERPGFEDVKEHLIEGVGYAGLAWYLQEYRANAGRTDIAGSAHNTYLRMLGEMGVFGLLAFLWLLWKCMKLSLEGVRRAANRADRQLAVALGAATLSLAISCAFGDRFFEITNTGNFWMLCALVQNQVLEARERPA